MDDNSSHMLRYIFFPMDNDGMIIADINLYSCISEKIDEIHNMRFDSSHMYSGDTVSPCIGNEKALSRGDCETSRETDISCFDTSREFHLFISSFIGISDSLETTDVITNWAFSYDTTTWMWYLQRAESRKKCGEDEDTCAYLLHKTFIKGFFGEAFGIYIKRVSFE